MIFFFQAEDGIRDIGVTGVQTCALPISPWGSSGFGTPTPTPWGYSSFGTPTSTPWGSTGQTGGIGGAPGRGGVGKGAGRGRREILGGGGPLKKKKKEENKNNID